MYLRKMAVCNGKENKMSVVFFLEISKFPRNCSKIVETFSLEMSGRARLLSNCRFAEKLFLLKEKLIH